MERENKKLGFGEILSYGLGISTGVQFIGCVVATYVLFFMTDVFGIGATAAGVIMMIATIWDAINDPMMGVIADKTKSRWGRYRPYLLFVPIPLAVVSVLLFAAPELSYSGKIVYAAVLYICYGMLTTMMQMPYYALIPAMTQESAERSKIVQVYTFIASVTVLIATSFTTLFADILGGGNPSKGYMILVGIGGILMVISSFIAFKNCKERYVEDKETEPLMKSLKKMFSQKQLYPVLVIWCLGGMGFQVMMSSSVYYVMYVLCRPDLITLYMLSISIAGMVGIMVVMPILMKVFKGSVKACFIFTQVITAVASLIAFIVGGNSIAIIFVCSIIGSLFATMSNAYIPLIAVEMVDYMELKIGQQLNATVSSLRGFSYKCGNALANGVIGFLLGATGFVAGNIGGQTSSALVGIGACRWLVPVATAVIVCICLMFYPVTNEVKADVKEMHSKKVYEKEN